MPFRAQAPAIYPRDAEFDRRVVEQKPRFEIVGAVDQAMHACQQPLEWYKEGVSPYDYAADVTYCDGARDQVAAYTPDDEMYLVRLYEIEAYNNCMRSRGYRLVEPGYAPQAQSAPGPKQGARQ